MKTRQFGSSAHHISEIGLGLAALGRPGYINLGHGTDLGHEYKVTAMEQHTHQMLDQAYQLGIRYFDAARSYGKAELFLSNWLLSQSDHELTIGSKWGYTYTADWQIQAENHEVKEHSIQVLSRQWEESTALLGGNLDIYHIHSATLTSGVLKNKEVLKKLWELKEKGVLIGLSTSGVVQVDTLEAALALKDGKRLLFDSAQVTWNVLETSTSQILEKAAASGLGIIVKESLANGRLTVRNTAASFQKNYSLLKNMSIAYATSIDALAIAYVLAQPWVSTVLSGAAQPTHLISNCKATELTLAKSDITILKKLAEAPTDYWQSRSALAWN